MYLSMLDCSALRSRRQGFYRLFDLPPFAHNPASCAIAVHPAPDQFFSTAVSYRVYVIQNRRGDLFGYPMMSAESNQHNAGAFAMDSRSEDLGH